MKTNADEHPTAHANNHICAVGKTVTIGIDAFAALERLASSFELPESLMLERLVISAENNAMELAKIVPNGQACFNACELKFSLSQQDGILNDVNQA